MGRSKGGDKVSTPPPPPPPGKIRVAKGFLRNTGTGTNLTQKAIGPLGSNCFSREAYTAVYNCTLMTKKTTSPPSTDGISGSAHRNKFDLTLKKLNILFILSSNNLFKKASMIRKYHKLQTNPRHHEEELKDIYCIKTSKRQQKQSNQLSPPCQED